MDKTLLIRANVQGQRALLTLNGLVLAELLDGREVRVPVHEYVQPGENRIQVLVLDKRLVQTRQALAPSDCSVDLAVELQKDRGPGSLVVPTELYRFNDTVRKGQRLHKSRVLDVWVNLPVSFPRWRYLDVLQSASDEADQIRIQDFLLSLIRLIEARKVSSLLPCFTVRNQEIAAAYGLDLQQVLSAFSSEWNRLFEQFTLCESVTDSNSWNFFKVRNTSVYCLLNTDYQPLLQFDSRNEPVRRLWPLHVGVLGGEVFVLR